MLKSKKHIIIAGTNKAGTTSVFKYLEEHPSICSSSVKQTNFFLDSDYNQGKALTLHKFDNSKDTYYNFFPNSLDSQFLMEASPDYLYSKSAPERIKNVLGDSVQLVFILREPVSRFFSWYKFAKMTNLIDNATTVEDFLQQNRVQNKEFNLAYNALETGEYHKYLSKFYSLFDSNQIYVCFYEDLQKRPQYFIEQLSNAIGIDPSFYNNYEFKTFNKTVAVKNQQLNSVYINLRKKVVGTLSKYSIFKPLLGLLRMIIVPIYRNFNSGEAAESTSNDKQYKSELNTYYEDANEKLATLINQSVSWNRPQKVS